MPVPPLVDQETWDAAQRSLSQAKVFPTREVTFPYLLLGLARCGQCGGAMRCHTSAQCQGAKPYFRCDRAARTPINCERCPGPGSVRAEAVDAAVWAYVERLLSDPNTLRAEIERMILAESDDGASVDESLAGVAREMAALDDARARAVRAMVRGVLTEDESDAETRELDRQRAPLVQRRELLLMRQLGEGDRRARLSAVEQRLAALKTALPNISEERRITLVRALVERVTLDTAKREIRPDRRAGASADWPAGAWGRVGARYDAEGQNGSCEAESAWFGRFWQLRRQCEFRWVRWKLSYRRCRDSAARTGSWSSRTGRASRVTPSPWPVCFALQQAAGRCSEAWEW